MVSISHQDKAPELAAALKEAALSPVASSRGMSLADVAQTVAALEESLGWATFNLVERLEKDGWATFWDIYYWDYYWDDYLGYIFIVLSFCFFPIFFFFARFADTVFSTVSEKERPHLATCFFLELTHLPYPYFGFGCVPWDFFLWSHVVAGRQQRGSCWKNQSVCSGLPTS